MGYKGAVTIAQAISAFLAEQAIGDEPVHAEVYVDNVIFLSNDRAALKRVQQKFEAMCREFSVTIGDSAPIATECEFRGLKLDLDQQTVRLKQSYVDKLQRRWSLVSSGRMSYAQYQSILGMLVYARYATGTPLSTLFHPFKQLAKLARRHTPQNAKIDTPRYVCDEMQREITDVCANPPLSPIVDESGIAVYTDASDTGYGAVIVYPEGTIELMSGAFHSVDWHINVREAWTVLWLLRNTRKLKGIVHLFVDNMVTKLVIEKTMSKAFHLNSLVTSIYERLRQIGVELIITYIPSKLNPSDPMSRDGDVDEVIARLDAALRAGFGVAESEG